MKTLVVGHVTHDRYRGGFVAGGCAYYGAKVHEALGGQVRLATVVGEDFECYEALDDLEFVAVEAGETTTFANYYPEDGPRFQILEARASDVPEGLVGRKGLDADVVHLAPVCGEVDLAGWIGAVDASLVAINVQGWLKEPGEIVEPGRFEQMQSRGVDGPAPRIVETPWEVDDELLSAIDIACVSREDLLEQTGLLERLVDRVWVVALTRGQEGARIFVDGRATDVGVVETDVEDPTGAGDAFAAAFVHQIGAGLEPVEAARWGAAAASIVIEGIGSRPTDSMEKLERRVRKVAVEGRRTSQN